MDLLDTLATRVVAKALDGTEQRHEAIVSNIANAETPDYQSVGVDFENNLKEAMNAEEATSSGQPAPQFLPPGSLKTTNSKHFNPNPVPGSLAEAHSMVERATFHYRLDGNSVDIEKSMSDLAKNTERYEALSHMENKMFSNLSAVIKG